jgi:hypothetical protein
MKGVGMRRLDTQGMGVDDMGIIRAMDTGGIIMDKGMDRDKVVMVNTTKEDVIKANHPVDHETLQQVLEDHTTTNHRLRPL